MLLCMDAFMYGCFYEYAFMNKCLYGPHSEWLCQGVENKENKEIRMENSKQKKSNYGLPNCLLNIY